MFNRLILFVLFMTVSSFGADVKNGAELFDGTKSFEKGGVACVACHNVKSDKVISGGNLAMDLSEMGGALSYTLSSIDSMSSDVMKVAYKGKLPTAKEMADIDAFVMEAMANPSEGFGKYFVVFALILAVILFFLLAKFSGRKELKTSVNQELYDRQKKSSWRK